MVVRQARTPEVACAVAMARPRAQVAAMAPSEHESSASDVPLEWLSSSTMSGPVCVIVDCLDEPLAPQFRTTQHRVEAALRSSGCTEVEWLLLARPDERSPDIPFSTGAPARWDGFIGSPELLGGLSREDAESYAENIAPGRGRAAVAHAIRSGYAVLAGMPAGVRWLAANPRDPANLGAWFVADPTKLLAATLELLAPLMPSEHEAPGVSWLNALAPAEAAFARAQLLLNRAGNAQEAWRRITHERNGVAWLDTATEDVAVWLARRAPELLPRLLDVAPFEVLRAPDLRARVTANEFVSACRTLDVRHQLPLSLVGTPAPERWGLADDPDDAIILRHLLAWIDEAAEGSPENAIVRHIIWRIAPRSRDDAELVARATADVLHARLPALVREAALTCLLEMRGDRAERARALLDALRDEPDLLVPTIVTAAGPEARGAELLELLPTVYWGRQAADPVLALAGRRLLAASGTPHEHLAAFRWLTRTSSSYGCWAGPRTTLEAVIVWPLIQQLTDSTVRETFGAVFCTPGGAARLGAIFENMGPVDAPELLPALRDTLVSALALCNVSPDRQHLLCLERLHALEHGQRFSDSEGFAATLLSAREMETHAPHRRALDELLRLSTGLRAQSTEETDANSDRACAEISEGPEIPAPARDPSESSTPVEPWRTPEGEWRPPIDSADSSSAGPTWKSDAAEDEGPSPSDGAVPWTCARDEDFEDHILESLLVVLGRISQDGAEKPHTHFGVSHSAYAVFDALSLEESTGDLSIAGLVIPRGKAIPPRAMYTFLAAATALRQAALPWPRLSPGVAGVLIQSVIVHEWSERQNALSALLAEVAFADYVRFAWECWRHLLERIESAATDLPAYLSAWPLEPALFRHVQFRSALTDALQGIVARTAATQDTRVLLPWYGPPLPVGTIVGETLRATGARMPEAFPHIEAVLAYTSSVERWWPPIGSILTEIFAIAPAAAWSWAVDAARRHPSLRRMFLRAFLVGTRKGHRPRVTGVSEGGTLALPDVVAAYQLAAMEQSLFVRVDREDPPEDLHDALLEGFAEMLATADAPDRLTALRQLAIAHHADWVLIRTCYAVLRDEERA